MHSNNTEENLTEAATYSLRQVKKGRFSLQISVLLNYRVCPKCKRWGEASNELGHGFTQTADFGSQGSKSMKSIGALSLTAIFFTVELQWYLKYVCIIETHFFSFAVHIYWTCDLLVSLNKLIMLLWKKERMQRERKTEQRPGNLQLHSYRGWAIKNTVICKASGNKGIEIFPL